MRRQSEVEFIRQMGFDAEYVASAPYVGRPAVRFASQGRIHPRKYLAALADAILAAGGHIYEQSEAVQFADQPRAVKVNGRTVTCGDIVIATHNPLVGLGGMAGATLFQTKLALYTSYVAAGRVGQQRGHCGGPAPDYVSNYGLTWHGKQRVRTFTVGGNYTTCSSEVNRIMDATCRFIWSVLGPSPEVCVPPA